MQWKPQGGGTVKFSIYRLGRLFGGQNFEFPYYYFFFFFIFFFFYFSFIIFFKGGGGGGRSENNSIFLGMCVLVDMFLGHWVIFKKI